MLQSNPKVFLSSIKTIAEMCYSGLAKNQRLAMEVRIETPNE